jgi:hypothetical protein
VQTNSRPQIDILYVLAPKDAILCLAWLDPYQGLQKQDTKLSKVMEQLDLLLGDSKSSSS